jgi:hypothetical protein
MKSEKNGSLPLPREGWGGVSGIFARVLLLVKIENLT